ncbi:hypothetical protein D3C86_1961790 [compost metagenome]
MAFILTVAISVISISVTVVTITIAIAIAIPSPVSTIAVIGWTMIDIHDHFRSITVTIVEELRDI